MWNESLFLPDEDGYETVPLEQPTVLIVSEGQAGEQQCSETVRQICVS